MDLILPLPVRVSKITTRILSNTAATPSIFTNATRTLARGGDRFGFDITVTGASDREAFPMRAVLRSLVTGLRGQANRIWVADPSYKLRGSFPTGELVVNGNFAQGASGWSVYAGSSTFSVADGYATVVSTSGSGNAVIGNAAAIPIVNGAAYAVRAMLYPGHQTTPAWIVEGDPSSPGSNSYCGSSYSTQQLAVLSFTASGTTLYVGIGFVSGAAGEFEYFPFVSVSRCMLVNGAGQTGATLGIKGVPSGAGLLLPGDRVQIGTQLNTVAAPMSDNGSGGAYLQCAVPWRVSPPDGAPIIVSNPMARCVLTSNSNSWDESPGGLADFAFSVQESLDA